VPEPSRTQRIADEELVLLAHMIGDGTDRASRISPPGTPASTSKILPRSRTPPSTLASPRCETSIPRPVSSRCGCPRRTG
jgi:hypothetical protein